MPTCQCTDGCLCDVQITAPTEIAAINFAQDSLYGKEIFEHLRLSTPLTDADILRFFEMQIHIKDRMERVDVAYQPPKLFSDGRVNVAVERSKLTAEMRDFIAARVNAGVGSPQIRTELLEKFGVSVSASHMSHMRKRVFGTRGGSK